MAPDLWVLLEETQFPAISSRLSTPPIDLRQATLCPIGF